MTNLAAPALTSLGFVTTFPVSPSFFDTFDNGNKSPIGPVARMTTNRFKRADAIRRWARLNESTKRMTMRHHGDGGVRRSSDQWDCADTLLRFAAEAKETARRWEKDTSEPLDLSESVFQANLPPPPPRQPPPPRPSRPKVLKPYKLVGVGRIDLRKSILRELRVPSSMTLQKRREAERQTLSFLEKRREEQQAVQRHETKRKEKKEWDENIRAVAQLTARTPDPWVAVELSSAPAVADGGTSMHRPS